jgi:putative peptidoglycan lipid II flippase
MTLLVLIALVIVLVKSCSGPSKPAAPAVVPIVAASAFDPTTDGGNGEENDNQANLAIDGDPTTAWTSEVYLNNPKLGGLKFGVGLVLDLGQTRTVTQVEVTFGATPVTFDVRVPGTDPTGASPGLDSQSQWTIVGGPTTATASPITVTLPTPTATRWVLVYFTSLAQTTPQHYQAIVDEITVTAS